MEEFLKYLKEKNAELVYNSEHFAHIRINDYANHESVAWMAATGDDELSHKAILFEATKCHTTSSDAFQVAVYARGNLLSCIAHTFGGSILNRWWYGYANDNSPFWHALNKGVEPAQIVEYLKNFWDD